MAVTRLPAMSPNMADYWQWRRVFTWENVWHELGIAPTGLVNITETVLDRPARGPQADAVALRFLDAGMQGIDLTYRALAAAVNRFTNALTALDVPQGAVVASFMGRLPELYVTALGAMKAGCTFCPLFPVFGPDPAQARLELGRAQVLVTTESLYRRKIAPIRARLPMLRHVLVVRSGPARALPEGVHDFHVICDAQASEAAPSPTQAEHPALLHFTSGTTGAPKGVIHVHAAVIAQYASARIALDLHPGDVYWCTADPGCATGTAFGIIAPLACGVRMVVDSQQFDARRAYAILGQESVAVWYTTPAAIRMLMKAGTAPLAGRNLGALRFVGSGGEPLNPEAVAWGARVLGRPFHDNWWQTETGAIMIANYACMPIRPGSMGRPLPGVEAAVVEVSADGAVTPIETPHVTGELALRPGWPSMFRAYLDAPERYAACFSDGWYLTGDLVCRDTDGYYWFVGRADDVIKSAGRLISPFEVESALMRHPAVAQAAVIGQPDPLLHQVVRGYVELRPGVVADDALAQSLMAHARSQLGAAVAPRQITIVPSLPRTRSGEIMRRLLRARELGEPEGDLSMLEPPA